MARIAFAALAVLAGLAAVPAGAARDAVAAPPVAAPAPAVASVRGGVDLWRSGDYAGAVAMWQPFANAGDADAMFNIGQAYKLGRAVARDAGRARDYYRRAAAKGHLPAQANLGIMLFQAGEKPEAVRWLKAAADKGEMRAQYVLGVANWNGDGTARNLTLAYAYLSRASAQGLAEATTALGGLTAVIAPIERANGWAVATSLAAGTGVPGLFSGAAASGRIGRDQVIKPMPKPVMTADATPAAAPAPAPVVDPLPAPTATKPVATLVPPVLPPVAAKPVIVAAAPSVAPKPAAVPEPAKPSAIAVPKPAEKPPSAPVVAAAVSATMAATAPAAIPPKAIIVAEKPKPVQVAAAVAKPVAKAPPGWRVQLGAFARRAQAEAAWAEVKAKQKQLVANTKPIYEPAGSVTKLQLGPYASKTAARDACARIAFSGRACFVTEG